MSLSSLLSTLTSQLINNPINWVLGSLALYMLVHIATTPDSKKEYARNLEPQKQPEPTVLRDFTPKELSEFEGRKNKKIYLAVCGRVYDVTAGAGFYGPRGMYGNFAGRDASR